MQCWAFRNSYDGFFDWLGSIRKIKLRYHMLCVNRGTGLIEFHFDEFIETKNAYMQYLKLMLELNDNERAYVKAFIAHQSPSRLVFRQIDLNF